MTENQELEIYSDDLIIPIYIDTNALLDLLASLERGFSTVEKITTKNEQNRNSEQTINTNAGTEFGIPNILSLLKVNLSGSLNRKQGKGNSQETSSERYHTYGSLLQRLRIALINLELVKILEDVEDEWNSIQTYDFIELQGKFNLNPFTESFGTLNRMMGIFELFAPPSKVNTNTNTNSKRNRPQVVTSAPTNSPFGTISAEEVKLYRGYIEGLIGGLEKNDIRTLVVDLNGSNKHRAILNIFIENLRDKTMTELQYKQFKLLGKVVGKISNSNESIDLLQGTALSGFDDNTIDKLIEGFNQPNSGLNLPKIETKIKGPALQVIPIAIYV